MNAWESGLHVLSELVLLGHSRLHSANHLAFAESGNFIWREGEQQTVHAVVCVAADTLTQMPQRQCLLLVLWSHHRAADTPATVGGRAIIAVDEHFRISVLSFT